MQATPLSGTDGARNPFFSPDGQWIAFFAGGKLKKISVTGGAAVTLCDAPNGRGGTWAEDGTIAFAPNTEGTSVWRVSSAGGTPESLTTVGEGEFNQRWPQVLPGGKAVLYTTQGAIVGVDNANIVVQPLPNGPRKIVQRGGIYGRYLPSGPKGHLVYLHDGTLFAAPFDLDRLELAGQPVPALEGVAFNAVTGGPVRGGGQRHAGVSAGTERQQRRARSPGWIAKGRRRRCGPRPRTGAIPPSRPMAAGSPWTSSMASNRTCGSTTGRATRCRA